MWKEGASDELRRGDAILAMALAPCPLSAHRGYDHLARFAILGA